MKTTESECNRWRGMALVGKHPARDDMFRLLDDRDECEELERRIRWLAERFDGGVGTHATPEALGDAVRALLDRD